MPFKTRRQKQSAAARRFSFDSGGAVTYYQPNEGKAGKIKPLEVVGGKSDTNNGEIFGLSYIKKDLLKIALFAFLIVGAQLLLKFYLKI